MDTSSPSRWQREIDARSARTNFADVSRWRSNPVIDGGIPAAMLDDAQHSQCTVSGTEPQVVRAAFQGVIGSDLSADETGDFAASIELLPRCRAPHGPNPASRRMTVDPRRHDGSIAAALRVIACVLVLVVLVTFASACGSTTTDTATQPLAKTGPVSFEQVPRYQGSTPVAHSNVVGSATTQTFSLNGVSPQELLAFYSRELGHWTVIVKPHALTSGTQSAWRGRWSNGKSTIIVSSEATPGPYTKSLQYSLDLRTS